MRRHHLLLLLVLVPLVLAAQSAEAAGGKKYDTGVARYNPVVEKACAYLREYGFKRIKAGERELAAYALLKAGEDYEQEPIKTVIQSVVAKARSGTYRPGSDYEHIYEAGVDAMLLADSDPDKYRPTIQAIAKYIASQQRSDGSWSHPKTDPGDVSMSQYGVLGLWAAHRAKANVDLSKVERAARWHGSKFNADGGFGYRPGTTKGPGGGRSTPNMTLAGMGSLAISRFIFYPEAVADKQKEKLKFGVAKGVKPPTTAKDGAPAFKPGISRTALDGGINRAFGWSSANFSPISRAEHKIYYYYAMERAFALAKIDKVRGANWFTTCGDYLMSEQNDDGSWKTHASAQVGTSFAVLFFMRSTGRIIGADYGGGILKAARGLPKDLTQAFNPDDAASKKEVKLDPLDDLLAELEKADLSKIDARAEDIVKKIELGDREELVGQLDRLKKLVDHPTPSVRRTVLYAMGRSGDFSVVPDLIKNLEFNDVDVMREAHEALCYVSRKPNGFGLPSNPLDGFEGTNVAQRGERIVNWRRNAVRKWKQWWFRVRPYDQRDDFEEASILRGAAEQR